MPAIEISLWAVGAAALTMFVLGGLWFGLVVARPWQRLAGLTDEQVRSGVGIVFGGSAVVAVVIATSLAAFIGGAGPVAGVAAGAVAGVTFAAAPLVMVGLFERRRPLLLVLDCAYLVVTFTAMGLVIGVLQ